jgi:hypothetical protein
MKLKKWRPSSLLIWLILLFQILCAGVFVSATVWPSVRAQTADVLRVLIGDSAVTWLESQAFRIHDAFQQWEYQTGAAKPAAPWAAVTLPSHLKIPSESMVASATPTGAQESVSATPEPTAEITPSPTATMARWPPAAIPDIGRLPEEGRWIPYLSDAHGQIVAYRTFLQPDPARPYTILAIVAVDLDRVRLEYVLGFTEPLSNIKVERTGIIPKEDRKPGVLLAAFNGGFLTRHGLFGVMAGGQILMPVREGLGSLVIYNDGRVRIGTWGSDLTFSDDIKVIRQNGPMVVEEGVINPKTNDNSGEDWGYTVHGDIATWRSAVGISADGRTLYYAAGWSLTMPVLAQALKTVGIWSALQLDINEYWVLFSEIQFEQRVPKAVPLLEEMKDNVGRYLYASARDYFYLAEKTP